MNDDWPTNNTLAGIDPKANHVGTYVNSVEVNSNVITITFGEGVHKNQNIKLTASDEGGSISWACTASVIKDNQLPTICTGQ